MSLSGSRQRQAACPCGSGRTLAACCLPWEEAFQRLFSRLMAVADAPAVRLQEAQAAAVFWDTQRPVRAGDGRGTGESLRFLEWFLLDWLNRRRGGPLLAEFADTAIGLGPREEEALFALLLSPMRAYGVTDTLGPRGFLLKDLLTGSERTLSPLGIGDPPIRGDVVICRLAGLGRVLRVAASVLIVPGAGREELSAYLRTTYRVTRPARHLSLEDFLDSSAHLYHHFFLRRGRELGGRAQETVRRAAFSPGQAIYRGTDEGRIRAGLDRQSGLVREAETDGGCEYIRMDPRWAVTQATVRVGSGWLQVRADTQQDLTESRRFLEDCLRGLIQPEAQPGKEQAAAPRDDDPRARSGPAGATFFARMLARWPDTPSGVLNDRTPRDAVKSQAGRQQVLALLLGLEQDFARLKRLGRTGADVFPLREQLGLLPVPRRSVRRTR